MTITPAIFQRIRLSLFLLRLGIFVVLAIRVLDKFLRPDHAKAVFDYFYGIIDVSDRLIYALAIAQTIIAICFLLGLAQRLTYGLVLLIHSISTFGPYQQYLSPFANNSLLFFAAWPMLAACFALYLLRDLDTWSIAGYRRKKSTI